MNYEQLAHVLSAPGKSVFIEPLIEALLTGDEGKVRDVEFPALDLRGAHDVKTVRDYLFATSFCKKLVPETEEVIKEADRNAIKKWHLQEVKNKQTAERLKAWYKNRVLDPQCNLVTKTIFLRWRMEIAEFFMTMKDPIVPAVTTGATYDRKRGCPIAKRLDYPLSVTELCIEQLHTFGVMRYNRDGSSSSLDGGVYHDDKYDIVHGAILQSVPKTLKTSRIIAKEPTVNIAYQCGVGRAIRKHLKKRYGLDIKTAQDLHGKLVVAGSMLDYYSTLDLSSASDSISLELVRMLLPKDVFEVLSKLRSAKIHVPYGPESEEPYWHEANMWATSGNGFCFEFETLLFYTLIRACGAFREIYVYGDDMIVDKYGDAELLIKALSFFGFTVNQEKSFIHGPFKESCGVDVYTGYKVRGYYVKHNPRYAIDWIRIANGIRRSYYCADSCAWHDEYFYHVWLRCIQSIDEDKRLFGPAYLGDVCIHGPKWFWTTRNKKRKCPYTGEDIWEHQIKVFHQSIPRDAYLDLYVPDQRTGRRLPAAAIENAFTFGQKSLFMLNPLIKDGKVVRDENGDVVFDSNKSHLVTDASHPSFRDSGIGRRAYNPAWKVLRHHPEIWDGVDVDQLFEAIDRTVIQRGRCNLLVSSTVRDTRWQKIRGRALLKALEDELAADRKLRIWRNHFFEGAEPQETVAEF